MKGFGDVLRGARMAAGLSLGDVAARTRIRPGELSKYENNKVGVDFAIVDELADLYGFEREELAVECLRARYPKVPPYKPKKRL